MPIPKGFDDLVKLAVKDRPEKPKTIEEVWDKFLFVVFMGGKRSEPEIQFITTMLKAKKLVQFDYVLKTDGDDWREAVEAVLNDRLKRMQDEDLKVALKEFQKEIFRISASIKGGARFLKNMTPDGLAEALSNKEKTWEFIENLANNQDVSNIKYTKIIIWLHSIGYGYDFCPPSWQTKKFINTEVGPYYNFYEDDKYFMKKAEEFSEDVKKKVKGATARDVSAAIYYYMVLKNSLPTRSPIKKRCTAAVIVRFLKKKKLSLKDISAALVDFDGRERIMKTFFEFLNKTK